MINKNSLYSIIATITLLFLGTTYFLLFVHQYMELHILFPLLCCDIIFISFFIYVVFKKLIKTLRHTKSSKKSNFQRQVVILFTCTTIIPAICVFIFAVLFFNFGIERLFKEPVKNVIENANAVAVFYIEEMKTNLKHYTTSISKQFIAIINDISYNDNINTILQNEIRLVDTNAIILQTLNGKTVNILAESDFSMSLKYEEIPHKALFLQNGEVMVWETYSSIIAIAPIDQSIGIYIVVSKSIDPVILSHRHKIKYAAEEYSILASQRVVLKNTFISLFSYIVLFMLLIVLLFGIIFAKRITRSVNKLITAVKNVNLAHDISTITHIQSNNEIDALIDSFNNMVLALKRQKNDIIISNRQNAWRDIARKIAHEIKNPLTPIQLAVERIKNKYSGEIKTNKDIFFACIDTIIRQVKCIEKLVSEFSDFARMPSPAPENTNIVKLVQDSILMHQETAKNICFDLSCNFDTLMCYIDPYQISQLLTNVLQNAINAITEHCKHGNIYVSITKNDDMCKISVDDTGPGFSENALKHALDPYFTTRSNGNGLGLSIVHKIAVEHGGSVEIQNSTKYCGASVRINIPISVL